MVEKTAFEISQTKDALDHKENSMGIFGKTT